MIKRLIPLSVRNRFRPNYHQILRAWDEGCWKPRPRQWHDARQRAHATTDIDALLKQAQAEFGLSQISSEASQLLSFLLELQPETIVEVGTHKGGNSFLFCRALLSARLVIGIDLHVQNAGKLKFFARPQQQYIVLHGDSQTTEMRDRVDRALAGRRVDFLFIDGDHSYKGVRSDFELYAPLVRPGGLIALHDIVADHNTRFGLDTGCYSGDVHRFWEELRTRWSTCREIVEDPGQDGFGIGVLTV